MEALDKVVTQWFYLNLLNTAALVFLLIKNYPIKSFFYNRLSVLFFSYFVWSLISFFFAINKMESVVVLSQIFAIVIAFTIITICISKIDRSFNFISNVISAYLIIELGYIYLPFTKDLDALSNIFSRSYLFLGFAANVNITAFSILYKIPFFIYSVMQLKKLKIGLIIPSFIIFLLIIFASGTLNSTRGAILTYTSLAPILFLIGMIVYLKSKSNHLLILSLTYSFAFIVSFPLNSFLSMSLDKGEQKITNRISTLTTILNDDKKNDESINQRLNFYSQAFNFILKNPVFGTGIGNWKIKSIDTNKENIIGYKVPYHVHNDFLEIGAETGLIGLGLYLSILFVGFKDSISKFLSMLFTKIRYEKNYLLHITIFLFLFIFLIDSNLNFPFYRPIVLINLIVLLSYLNSKKIIDNYGK